MGIMYFLKDIFHVWTLFKVYFNEVVETFA